MQGEIDSRSEKLSAKQRKSQRSGTESWAYFVKITNEKQKRRQSRYEEKTCRINKFRTRGGERI